MKEKIFVSIILIITFLFLLLAIKGQKGNPFYFQSEKDNSIGGPFELSSSTSRYALVQAIVNNQTFFLNKDLAKFASPDVVLYRGNFFSIFTPGVSFIGVPFYILGNYLTIPQIATYFSVILASFINVILITKIARKLGASMYASIASGLIFLFSTDALTYALTFTQHQFSTLIILLSILVAFSNKSFVNNILFGLLAGVGLLLDIPNLILITPVALYLIAKNINFTQSQEKLNLTIKISIIWAAVALLPFIGLFAFYNYKTASSFTKIGQFIGRTDYFKFISPQRNNVSNITTNNSDISFKGLSLPFQTRDQLTGFYILLISNERSWLYYSPIVLIGLAGYLLVYKEKEKRTFVVITISTIITGIIVYSMFGDPWGGWAFGPRYLIPAAAILASGIGITLDYFRKKIYVIIPIVALILYSTYVSTLGALTSSAIPPKVEAVNLPTKIPYTYAYNQQLINKNFSSSLFYNLFLSNNISAKLYFYIFFGLSSALILSTIAISYFQKQKK